MMFSFLCFICVSLSVPMPVYSYVLSSLIVFTSLLHFLYQTVCWMLCPLNFSFCLFSVFCVLISVRLKMYLFQEYRFILHSPQNVILPTTHSVCCSDADEIILKKALFNKHYCIQIHAFLICK